MNTIMTCLSTSKNDKLSSCTTTQTIWNILEKYHGGSKSLWNVKLGQLMDDYGGFKMKENEMIMEGQGRFRL